MSLAKSYKPGDLELNPVLGPDLITAHHRSRGQPVSMSVDLFLSM